ncbi:TcpE family conjugal transfer membrane protein [Bacillus pseudomycoides]|uniref:TcpE family conjugal transfer membrane protein n=1 Tax=Bacillus pseudomycoides TaxID=64104 RepID=UPI000BF2FEC7|nr:TcpE family conjugal transfer membrane protein [Bacillus pseudomycoides]PGD96675.1 conjugal transfer protein [Bacillus pseudomycoides]PHE64580.1 conjugal transfer protein [Bacillus pseudomycoides]
MQEPKQNSIVVYCYGSYMKFLRRQYELMGKRLPRAITWRAMGYFVVMEAGLVALRFLPPFKWWFGDFIDRFYLVYYIVLPIFLIWGVDQYKTDDKSLLAYFRARVGFMFRKHRSSRLVHMSKLQKHVIRGATFVQYESSDLENREHSIEEKNVDIHAYSLTFLNQKEEL